MNVVYIHTHDTGKVISPYGFKVPTPNYEAFCSENVLFQNAFCVAPTCSPSRAGLLTGVYPHQNGMLGLAQRGFALDRKLHLANFLKERGFRTILSGVQHEYAYYLDHDLAREPLGYTEDISADHKKYEEADLVYWDRENAEAVCKWIEAYDGKQPFFMSYGMHSTHRAFPKEIDSSIQKEFSQPPQTIFNVPDARVDFARYKTSAKMADANLGRIISTLKQKGLYEETIIILTTDHGIPYPFHKCTLKDTGIGVLLAIHCPDNESHISSFDGLVSHIDIFPTLCDLLGLHKPEYLMGKSFAGIFKGEKYEGDESIFAEINFHTSYEPARCVRTKRYKYIQFMDKTYKGINFSNIDQSPSKSFLNKNDLSQVEKPMEALYDLYYDPTEQNNLATNAKFKEVTNQMRELLEAHMIQTDDPLLEGEILINPAWKVNKKTCYAAGSKNPDDYDSMGEHIAESYHWNEKGGK